jgi:uncharacterized phiE125 gp8 family phage protein
MSLSIVTDVTSEPVSLDEAKAHLRVDFDDDDAYIADCIYAARVWVEGQTRKALMPRTYDYEIDWRWPMKYGMYRIDLPVNPVTSVTSINYIDTGGSSQTLATTEYTVKARNHHSYIVQAYDKSWPTTRYVPGAITVRFVAGDGDNISQSLHRAIMILAGHLYENRESAMKIPDAVEALIAPQRG